MATFVIVHGAGSGGWLWKSVREPLREAGHEALTPTLTGLGERSHLAQLAGEIDLELHIQDILGVLEYEEVHDAILVGHSYGGMVVAGVADRAADKLAQVVYIDAFVPGDGQSLFDLVPPQAREAFQQSVIKSADGRLFAPPLQYPSLGRMGEGALPEVDIRRLLERRMPQPLATYTQPVKLTNHPTEGVPHTYIHCTDKGPGDPFGYFAQQARARGWASHDLDTGHFPTLTTPVELAELLSRLV